MHSGEFELTKLTHTRLEDNLIRLFDIACLNEQSRNNDGHEGSSDGVLSDYPTVHCGIL